MKQYIDKHLRPIIPGMTLRCTLNREAVTIYGSGDDLGILGAELDGQRSFIPLASFGHEDLPDGVIKLSYFEII